MLARFTRAGFRRDGSAEWKSVAVPSTFQDHEGTDWHGVGWYERTVEVPDVTGQQQGAAEATLRQQGFNVIAQPEATCDENQGVVFAQNPEGGTEVSPGANVVIRVAEPPPQGCDN